MLKNTVLAAVLMLGFSALAAEAVKSNTTTEGSQSTTKIEDVKPGNKVEGNIDEEITNAKLRAESGSKSKFSLSSTVSYSGGAVDKPFGEKRPNLAGTPGAEAVTAARIGLSARYRATKNDSFTLGTTFGLRTPFQGDVDPKRGQMNVYNPIVSYARVGKVGAIQTTGTLSADYGTSKGSRDTEYMTGVGLSISGLYDWSNGLSTGLSVATGYSWFGNNPGEKTLEGTTQRGYGGDTRSDYSLNLYPFAEYRFTDRYSARTVFGYFNWQHLYGDDKSGRLLQTYVYQSIGVGISVTRDIYLYPNIQFVPDNIRDDFTNVALSATINMF